MEKNIGITVKKSEDISKWYTEVITKADLIEYTDVSGCIVYKPYLYQIWEILQKELDKRFKEIGIKNTYFPLFIPERFLNKEKEHVEGFAPEVAWVTEAGSSKLSERLAVRPTSETIMYPYIAKWIRSWRDLPLKLNQWNNVVRWEFKNPVPLMRSREFLWHEGHTAYATKEEAEAERDVILGIYQEILKNYMALYGVAGFKSEREKFAGAEYTTSIEFFLESGKAIQGPDFHHDGQKFSKAFDITFLDKEGNKKFVWQNTFAFTTRMIGVMIMMHGDDKGLILPPKVAPIQVVIVPIFKKDDKVEVLEKAYEIKDILKDFRVEIDERDEYSPGWKFNEWELKGVPLRIEIGKRDIQNNEVVIAIRDIGEKLSVNIGDLKAEVNRLLDELHERLYERSMNIFKSNIIEAETFEDVERAIKEKKMAYGAFCNDPKCEEEMKAKVEGLTTRCSPFGSDASGKKCVHCGKPAKLMIYFSRAY